MNFLRIENNEKGRNLLSLLQTSVSLTYLYKLWYDCELTYNAVAYNMGAFFGRALTYIIAGIIATLLVVISTGWSYTIFSRSKYSPCDENFNCRVSKASYTAVVCFVLLINNLLSGSLNFVAYCLPISTAFMVILLPKILNIIAICTIIALLYLQCRTGEKGEFKQLLVSMALPSVVLLVFVR